MALKRSVGLREAPTGYGQQTALFTPRLKEHYDLSISALYGLEGAKLVWKGIPVLPGTGSDFGNTFLLQHVKDRFGDDLRAGVVFTLIDVFPLNTQMCAQVNLAAWCPIDHDPVIPSTVNFFKDSGAVPVAMSRFGEEQLKAHDLDPLYVPHGVDTSIYKPGDKRAVRAEVQCPQDAFLVGMVAANKGRPSRKGFQQAFEAFTIFKRQHPEAILYLHTVADHMASGGEDLLALAGSLGIKDSIVMPPRYRMMHDPFIPEHMAQIYSSFDVLLNPSQGEGFGVPVIEAAACGVPAIVTDFTAMPEVGGPAAWKVGCRPYWTPGDSWMGVANVEEIVASLEAAYSESEVERKARSKMARDHALTYDVDVVTEKFFLPVMEEVFNRFEDRKPSVSRTELPAARAA